MITHFISAFDTERAATKHNCLTAWHEIGAALRRAKNGPLPATAFVVGKLLEDFPDTCRGLMSRPEIEVATHSYSHRVILPHPWAREADIDTCLETVVAEIKTGRRLVERIFGRECVGYRTAYGFDAEHGLRANPHVLKVIHEAGLHYVSSVLWGPDFSLPAQLCPPLTYADKGFPNLWEMPGHGWHENVLKGHSVIHNNVPRRLIGFPQEYPELVPLRPVTTPLEEFQLYQAYIERAIEIGLPYVSFIWHPWSLHQFDPKMQMLDLLFKYVNEIGMEVSTFADEYHRLAEAKAS
jgi:peptidoglycan/xylan/chitin deacetylase (PgdA/CDA1 family)